MTGLYLADADFESGLRRGARSSQLARRYTEISRKHRSPRRTLAALARVALVWLGGGVCTGAVRRTTGR